MKTFLLRFEEPVAQDKLVGARTPSLPNRNLADSGETSSTILAGTQTLTEIRHEGVDPDPGSSPCSLFPNKSNEDYDRSIYPPISRGRF